MRLVNYLENVDANKKTIYTGFPDNHELQVLYASLTVHDTLYEIGQYVIAFLCVFCVLYVYILVFVDSL